MMKNKKMYVVSFVVCTLAAIGTALLGDHGMLPLPWSGLISSILFSLAALSLGTLTASRAFTDKEEADAKASASSLFSGPVRFFVRASLSAQAPAQALPLA